MVCYSAYLAGFYSYRGRFPLPEIPRGWKPDPKRVWDKENSQKPEDSSQIGQEKPEKKWSRTGISADQASQRYFAKNEEIADTK